MMMGLRPGLAHRAAGTRAPKTSPGELLHSPAEGGLLGRGR